MTDREEATRAAVVIAERYRTAAWLIASDLAAFLMRERGEDWTERVEQHATAADALLRAALTEADEPPHWLALTRMIAADHRPAS